jgi:hypothetical protein
MRNACFVYFIHFDRILWLSLKEARVLQIEPNETYRKYKASAHMSMVDYLISQPNLDISPICIPIIEDEVKNVHPRSV